MKKGDKSNGPLWLTFSL